MEIETGELRRTCAYSGAVLPESSMVQIGGHWIATDQKDACVQFLQQGGVLPVVRPAKGSAPPPRFLPVCVESWRIFVLAFPAMLLMHFLVWLPGDLLDSYMSYEVFGEDDALKSIKFSMKLQGWVGIIADAGYLYALGVVWRGGKAGFGETVKSGFRFWPRMWLVNLLLGLAVIAGLLLLIIPGIILFVRYTFATCYAVDDDQKATASLGASYRLSRGNFWKVVGFVLPLFLAAIAPLFGIGMIQAFLPEAWNTWQLDGVMTWVAEIPALFVTAVVYVLWQALRQEQGEEFRP